MNAALIILIASILAVAVLLGTGRWRWLFSAFRIRRRVMTIEHLGLTVPPEDTGRVLGVLRSFAGGFNAMIIGPRWSTWQLFCESRPVLYRPFAHEGAAMGYPLRRLGRYGPADFEARVVKPRPEMRYLYYVGLGFWSGMRDHHPHKLLCLVESLDPLHGPLCYDGYGFKHGFFDYLKDRTVVRKFDALEGHARNVAYQGLGRAFWFLFMDDHSQLIERISDLGDSAADAAAGLGLAAVFTNPDRLEVPLNLGREVPPGWHQAFHLGMCFGLKARSITDGDEFRARLERAEPAVREAVTAGVEACDAAERRVRSAGGSEPYRRWREQVSDWMAARVTYPLAGLKPAAGKRLVREPAAS